LQFSLQVASPETFGYTLGCGISSAILETEVCAYTWNNVANDKPDNITCNYYVPTHGTTLPMTSLITLHVTTNSG